MKYRDDYRKLRVGHWKKGQNPFSPMVSPSTVPKAPTCLGQPAMQPSSSPPLQIHNPHHYTNNQHKTMKMGDTPKPRDKESGFNAHSI